MLKSMLLGGLAGTSLLLVPVAVLAQAGQLASPQPSTQAASPASVTAIELQQFVQAIKQLQVVDRQNQAKMAKVIEEEGLNPQRFSEIGQSLQNPNTPPANPISEEEKQKFQRAIEKMGKIQQESLPKQQRAISMQGLQVERFRQIDIAVQQDPVLKKRVQQMLGLPPK
jgi:hypothetical protein